MAVRVLFSEIETMTQTNPTHSGYLQQCDDAVTYMSDSSLNRGATSLVRNIDGKGISIA